MYYPDIELFNPLFDHAFWSRVNYFYN